jgi:hypothetical protein
MPPSYAAHNAVDYAAFDVVSLCDSSGGHAIGE